MFNIVTPRDSATGCACGNAAYPFEHDFVLLSVDASARYTVDDALNRCGTWDAFHWLMLFYCGLSWMCDVSAWQ
jgi:hypothetical protein